MLVIAVGTVYSGALFGKLSQLLPGSASFEDMARAALGKHGRWLVYCTVRRITSAGCGRQQVSSEQQPREQPSPHLERLALQAGQWLSAMPHMRHLPPTAPHTSTAKQDSQPSLSLPLPGPLPVHRDLHPPCLLSSVALQRTCMLSCLPQVSAPDCCPLRL